MQRFKLRLRVRIAQGQRAIHNGGDEVRLAGNERANDHPRALRLKGNVVAAEADRHHTGESGSMERGCAAAFISASARWKASEDSAPWLSLMRSAWRPS